jgi:hypothetical protein
MKRDLPVAKGRHRHGAVALDDRGVAGRSEDPRAAALGERGGRSRVVVMAMREQDVAERHVAARGPGDRTERVEDRAVVAGRARVDEVEAVAVADRIGLDERRAQAPQPVGDLLDVHAPDRSHERDRGRAP